MALATVVPGEARLLKDESTPYVVWLWRRLFTSLYLDWRYLFLQSILVNLVRALAPQRTDALNSYFVSNDRASVSTFRASMWVIRDILLQVQMFIVLALVCIRWAASQTAYVKNRTKVIASGGEDTLASFLFSMSCSSLFFAGAAVLGLVIFEPLLLFVDFKRHGDNFLSFFATKQADQWDIVLVSLHFFMALGSTAEHLSRCEIIAEDVLYRTDIGRNITMYFRLKRQLSVAATFTWVAFFFVRKSSFSIRLALRVVAAVFVLALACLHALASYYGLRHLIRTVDALDADLRIDYTRHGWVPGFLLKWTPRRKTERRTTYRNLLRVARQFFPIFLWHVSGRTVSAQIAMFISLCNWLPLVPAVQVELYSCIAVLTAICLFLFRLTMYMNPACVNTSGNEIPTLHVGFGMLVIKSQLLSCGPNNPDFRLKMVPASIERLFEAVTISYRWEPTTSFPVHVWNRDAPMTVQFRLDILQRAFNLLQARGIDLGWSTLVWFDQASIDQESEQFKSLLVPRMTACYALSAMTLVLDNTDTYPYGHQDNYYSRIWTFQEYCLPPCISVVSSSPLLTPAAVEANRRHIQNRYWSSSSGGNNNNNSSGHKPGKGTAVAAAEGYPNGEKQFFLVVGLDTTDTIDKWLHANPELISEYLATIDSRVGFKSSDRFAAIMQVIAGVICFTPAAVLQLKRAVLSTMAHKQSSLRGCTIIDNMSSAAASSAVAGGWLSTAPASAAAAGPPSHLVGTADVERILAGKPCPGDHGGRACLTFSEIDAVQEATSRPASASAAPPTAAAGTVTVGEGVAAGRGTGLLEILGSFVPYGNHDLPAIEVKALVDPSTRILRQLLVWPHSRGGGGGGGGDGCSHQHHLQRVCDGASQQQQGQQQRGVSGIGGSSGSGRQGQGQQQPGESAEGDPVGRLRLRGGLLQMIPVEMEDKQEWAIVLE
ncbi:hypothetical protein Agub_g3158 [Astrephomene gubernaculifera]|uniref:Uncharacterized protein n=1 Tax=Astrephomene gubernaculifera TaxID=47775 RepID=A0AAD3HIM7_9CHLO|nr:hypothetical protein Agub_g3158 [Astrephomene gubernaculifera]